ncbi:MAG: ABC transporter permease [Nanoarchaeota archaeon]
MIKDFFILALRNLRKRKLRTWLTLTGIFISVATIFMLVSLSLGLQNAVEEQFKSLGADKFFVQPGTGFLGPPGSVGGTILTEKDADNIKKVSGVKDVSESIFGNAKIEVGTTIRYQSVIGMYTKNDLFIETGTYKLNEGNFIRGDEKSVLLGNLHKTGNLWGREVVTGDRMTINGQSFRVKGILEKIGNPDDDSMVLMDINTFRGFFNITERVDWIVVQVNTGENVTDVASRVEKRLRQTRDVTEKTQDFQVLTPEELLSSFQSILGIITAFLAGVAAISLLVGAVGIANTMYTSVLERTREIGVMKSIGARNKDIFYIFLIESGLLGLAGAAMGISLGFIVSKGIEYIAINVLNTNLLQVATPFYLIFGCLTFGFLIGAVSGTFPAIRASKVNVVDALRYE